MRRLQADTDSMVRNVPVVAVSARSDMDKEMLSKYGFAAMLAKPFSQRELCEVLATVTRREASEVVVTNTTLPVISSEGEASGYRLSHLPHLRQVMKLRVAISWRLVARNCSSK